MAQRYLYSLFFVRLITYSHSKQRYSAFTCNSFRCRQFSSRNLLKDCVFHCVCMKSKAEKKMPSNKWHLEVSVPPKHRTVLKYSFFFLLWVFKWKYSIPFARVLMKQLNYIQAGRTKTRTWISFWILNLWHKMLWSVLSILLWAFLCFVVIFLSFFFFFWFFRFCFETKGFKWDSSLFSYRSFVAGSIDWQCIYGVYSKNVAF